jgi:hypothetical protein
MKKSHLNLLTLIISTTLMFGQNNWQTYFEKSNYLDSPDYNETMEYFTKLANASEYASLVSFGTSPQGRDLKCIIVSKTKQFSPTTP